MATRLRERQDLERRETLAQTIVLDVVRLMLRSGATHLDAAATCTAAADELLRIADRHAAAAVEEGESYTEVGSALNMTRQAATKRYRHLQAVE
ncbi:MAG: hypothetical protein H0V12_11245 [Chloroflexi bacterium]|nr:hypothetical protein [Chloroflexota bacterium]